MRTPYVPQDQRICNYLRELHRKHGSRYTDEASNALTRQLFHFLSNENPTYLQYLFPQGAPNNPNQRWKLSDAQGASEGAEYSAAARGKRCGHIFVKDEATYTCKTCTSDDTCVLCVKCFEASDHRGHQVYISLSSGSSGCCDCGDTEAWDRPLDCAIHTARPGDEISQRRKDKMPEVQLPEDLERSIRTTIARVFDFIVDVFSCSPEHLRLPKNETSIIRNEKMARLKPEVYGGDNSSEECQEFCLVLWNDEKHTWVEVEEQVARACSKSRKFALERAKEVDGLGRGILLYSKDVKSLQKKAKVLEQIKITVTIRSSRDTFREQMCWDMVSWLTDIAGCSVGGNTQILQTVICEEMLKPWRVGSRAYNLHVGINGIRDEQKSDRRISEMSDVFMRMQAARLELQRARREAQRQARRAQAEVNDPRPRTVRNTGTVPAQRTPNETTRMNANNIPNQAEDAMDLDEAMAGIDAEDADIDMDQVEGDEEEPTEGIMTGFMTPGGGFQSITGAQHNHEASEESDVEQQATGSDRDPDTLLSHIPKTPRTRRTFLRHFPPSYWTEPGKQIEQQAQDAALPIYEDLKRRVRIDFLVLYDLRMWKNLRNDLRHLYISTVVTVPYFKRVLGLRFAAVYTWLAQLFLIADREPECSIINLSIQMLATPSITGEIIERANFFTKLLAVLYTFLTKRQVGHPEDVDLTVDTSFEPGAMTNRRIPHFFHDMRYLLESKFVQEKIRKHDQYLLQFLDFVKLYQGICPNIRQVGEHLEYESDAWVSAYYIVRDVSRMSRRFCESFAWNRTQDPSSICRAIRQSAKSTIINSLGCESGRFRQAELQGVIEFAPVALYDYEHHLRTESSVRPVVRCDVATSPMSFHHTLHYTLSWLIDCGKSMSSSQLNGLLMFTKPQLEMSDWPGTEKPDVPDWQAHQYLLALFDIPLRVCAWLVQMRAGMWVRNGISLRHQMSQYRSIAQRDKSAQRDIFLLQTALVVLPPELFLTAIVERFNVSRWVRGDLTINPDWEDGQMMSVFEDLIDCLITLLSDRTLLFPIEDEPDPLRIVTIREIAHALCFKPLSHSDLVERLSHRLVNKSRFNEILKECTSYRGPEGLQDTGVFELKDEFFPEIDPYNVYYNNNQREEAETILRKREAKRTGKPLDEVIYEQNLKPIKSGAFMTISAFSQTPLFAQIIWSALNVALNPTSIGSVPPTRVEAFLPLALQLLLSAVAEDKLESHGSPQPLKSFVDATLCIDVPQSKIKPVLIVEQLLLLLASPFHLSTRAKIRYAVRKIQAARPQLFESVLMMLDPKLQDIAANDATSMVSDDAAEKKRLARERQAQVMAAFKQQQNAFINNQNIDWSLEDEDEELDDEIGESSGAATVQYWDFPESTCIFCREDTKGDSRLYGSLGYMVTSVIDRQTDLSDKGSVREVGMVPANLDASAEDIRPFGIAGQKAKQLADRPDAKAFEGGFPKLNNRPGHVTTGCGHVMHFSCFEAFNTAIERRHEYQVARNHPERLDKKEFLCPLCKAMGNVFLPIVWKPSERVGASRLASTPGSFDQWLTARVPYLISRITDNSMFVKGSTTYLQEQLTPGLASKIAPSANPATTRPAAAIPKSSTFASLPFLTRPTAAQEIARKRSDEELPDSVVTDLHKAYSRLRSTIMTNHFESKYSMTTIDGLHNVDTLAKCLGNSIAVTEIAQRGVQCEGIWIDSLGESVLSHLRVFSETCSTYAAMSILETRTTKTEVRQHAQDQVQALLSAGSGDSNLPLLDSDSFVFLTECTLFSIPYLHLDEHHILLLCYLAEINKVLWAYFQNGKAAFECANLDLDGNEFRETCTANELQRFTIFIQHSLALFKQSYQPATSEYEARKPWLEENPNARFMFDKFLHAAISSYALTFLRKAALLFNIRYNIDFQMQGKNPDRMIPELQRLTQILDLPTLDNIFSMYTSQNAAPGAIAAQRLTSHWLNHWAASHGWQLNLKALGMTDEETNSFHRIGNGSASLQLSHPGIFELIPLPPAHDALNTAVMARQCPTIPNAPLTDPCICLFCGAFFCGQAACCTAAPSRSNMYMIGPIAGSTNTKLGGCAQHQLKCGRNIGVFLSIRRCAVLFLNGRNGSYFPAPYLDEHGEIDWNLRRKGRLWLNKKRYERLVRDVVLSHQVPSWIARRLEGEVNVGGWETI